MTKINANGSKILPSGKWLPLTLPPPPPRGHVLMNLTLTICISLSKTSEYWSRPNPSVSNSGLVIVQVDQDDVYQPPAVVHPSPSVVHATPSVVQWSNDSAATHQLIHGSPPQQQQQQQQQIKAVQQLQVVEENGDKTANRNQGKKIDNGYFRQFVTLLYLC